MSKGVLGLIEMLFIFGIALALGVRELLALRSSAPPARGSRPPSPSNPPPAPEPVPPKDPTS